MNMAVLFELIIDHTNQIMGTERGSVFLYDEKTAELWSLVATGMKKNEIWISSDYCVAVNIFQSKTPLIIYDAYNDPRFYTEVDELSGFRTKNILCIPLINRKGDCIVHAYRLKYLLVGSVSGQGMILPHQR